MLERQTQVARGPSQGTPVFAAKAEGALIEDVDGNRFLDFGSGIGVVNVGHAQPDLISAINAQVKNGLHFSINVTPYEGYIRVAEKLNRLVYCNQPAKTALFNSGAEAVENAIKIARAYTKRPAVIAF